MLMLMKKSLFAGHLTGGSIISNLFADLLQMRGHDLVFENNLNLLSWTSSSYSDSFFGIIRSFFEGFGTNDGMTIVNCDCDLRERTRRG